MFACAAHAADAEMWKCVDQDGKTRYTNLKADAKGCTGLNLEPMNTSPAPPPRPQPQQKPVNFPSVDSDTQRSRDAGRRKILEQELVQEQLQLEAARKQLTEQKEQRSGSERNYARYEERLKPFEDKVKQHELNLESLRKELANTR